MTPQELRDEALRKWPDVPNAHYIHDEWTRGLLLAAADLIEQQDAALTAIRKLTAMAKRSESDPAGWFNDIDRVLDGLAERP